MRWGQALAEFAGRGLENVRCLHIGLALVAALLAAVPAVGQNPVPSGSRNRFLEMRVAAQAPRYGKRPVTPLAPAFHESFLRARALRESGRLDAARDSLDRLLEAVPHHPLPLVELALVHESRRAWRSIETLARAERAWSRDSLLLAQELVTALDRQGRPRDAVQTVLEAWVSEPMHVDWARSWIDSLAALEPRGVRELLRRTCAALPGRADVARVAARIEWRYGDAPSAMRLLEASDAPGRGMPLRWMFAEEMVAQGTSRDSAGAVEALLELATDRSRDADHRVQAGRRAWDVASAQEGAARAAPRVAKAIRDVPADRWGSSLVVQLMRGLREGGLTEDSRALVRDLGESAQSIPEIALERALGDLREGDPERALAPLRALADAFPEASFHYAEALFFAGQPDSSHAWHERLARNPSTPFAGAALERIYLIEDARPKEALTLFGRLAYEEWRGEPKRALALAESLYRSLAHGPLWAQVGLRLASLREATGEGKAALAPLLAVAETLPDDRLAPVARQRAGDVLRIWHKNDGQALEQYEECLARYPKAWNAPEVRRWVETLRRERRF